MVKLVLSDSLHSVIKPTILQRIRSALKRTTPPFSATSVPIPPNNKSSQSQAPFPSAPMHKLLAASARIQRGLVVITPRIRPEGCLGPEIRRQMLSEITPQVVFLARSLRVVAFSEPTTLPPHSLQAACLAVHLTMLGPSAITRTITPLAISNSSPRQTRSAQVLVRTRTSRALLLLEALARVHNRSRVVSSVPLIPIQTLEPAPLGPTLKTTSNNQRATAYSVPTITSNNQQAITFLVPTTTNNNQPRTVCLARRSLLALVCSEPIIILPQTTPRWLIRSVGSI